ncbi:DNA-binding protein [Aquitalea aquatica]|uniref:DNA-binding protein n=1 Tax=Aquitalea aquatica TaxID=3044273 RepID=A0A838YA62_9NEIS|nr:DNA-binding protein [Aquitalea magnusonii]MBA4707925.1 DNA-binding protein [Aquitalea magnusonii]
MDNRMQVPTEVRDRIFSIANLLYEQSGRSEMPALDKVRELAGIDMVTASQVLKEWRKVLPASAAQLSGNTPEELSKTYNEMLSSVWECAKKIANQNLYAAQKSWEQERDELERLRLELSMAYDRQTQELIATQKQLSHQLSINTTNENKLNQMLPKLHEFGTKAVSAQEKVTVLEETVQQLENRLRTEPQESSFNPPQAADLANGAEAESLDAADRVSKFVKMS